jgi:hypothetical protein
MIRLPSVALSIRQPWAWLIIHGGKDVENRTWKTKFRGAVLIHAAKGLTADEWTIGVSFAREAWKRKPRPASAPTGVTGRTIDRGGIVGVADVVDCVTESDSPWFVGNFGFVLANPRALPFHPCKGALGFFQVDYPENLLSA